MGITKLFYYGARYYDPRTSVWLGVDAMSDKYPSLSPFAYCANNPILFFDPDGKSIWISHTVSINGKSFIQTVKYVNGSLYNSNGSKYSGSNSYFANVQNTLNDIRNIDSQGNSMINNLESSDLNHNIRFEPKEYSEIGANNSSLSGNIKSIDTPNGEKMASGSVTNFNPYDKNDINGKSADPRAVLAHELSHAADNDQAKTKSGWTKSGVSLKEVDAVRMENRINKALGIPLRTEYNGREIPKELLQ